MSYKTKIISVDNLVGRFNKGRSVTKIKNVLRDQFRPKFRENLCSIFSCSRKIENSILKHFTWIMAVS